MSLAKSLPYAMVRRCVLLFHSWRFKYAVGAYDRITLINPLYNISFDFLDNISDQSEREQVLNDFMRLDAYFWHREEFMLECMAFDIDLIALDGESLSDFLERVTAEINKYVNVDGSLSYKYDCLKSRIDDIWVIAEALAEFYINNVSDKGITLDADGELLIKNPAIYFAEFAKAGKYNSLSDEDYKHKLELVKTYARYFNDKPTVRLFPIAKCLVKDGNVLDICEGLSEVFDQDDMDD